jgi:transcriptional regulator with XRE-family HTH domain
MSYQLKISPKSKKSARFISRLQNIIQQALVESGMTQQEVARKLDVDRSVINKRLSGKANLTARSMAEFAFAFDRDIKVEFLRSDSKSGQNWAQTTGNVTDFKLLAKSKTSGNVAAPKQIKIESVAA